jgi:hypothetical protein
VFTNHRKEDEINPPRTKKYPLKRDSKSTQKRSIIKIYCKKHTKTPKKDLHFHLLEDIIVLYKDETSSSQHLYRTWQSVGTTVAFRTLATQVSKRQQNLWLTEKVCTYHQVTSNLADLAKNKRHNQNMVLYNQSCS